MIIAVVGAGGKTTYIKEQIRHYLEQGLKVFVTTTTHMYVEEDTLVTDDPEVIIAHLEKQHYAMAGKPADEEKIQSLSKETYEKVCSHADVVLVEADGSKHMPVKYPKEGEPVICDNVDEIVVVCGLHALGKPVSQVAHRLDLVKKCLRIEADECICPHHLQKLVRKGYLEPMKEQYSGKKITIKVNQGSAISSYADQDYCPSLYQRAVASLIENDIDVGLIKEEWFEPQPTLIVCGGGHVSRDLVKMASCLDFRIKVMDDRDDFVNKERFPEADELICDSFANLEQYLEPNAYYIVVTRGHKDDFTCVKTILSHSYQYLGMIGSKLKVGKTFENLRKAGVQQEQIDTVFAPIGLDIHAVTPPEIAISILAQVIMEKNKHHVASVSKELLNIREKGTLCIIIEKTGSSPRGVGSMMFVTQTETIDSIGGGAVEFATIEEARNCTQVMIKEYNLDDEKSRELGMICGGRNKVLFIPIT